MKKFLSLLLAAMLCLCALTPAMAEEAAAVPAEETPNVTLTLPMSFAAFQENLLAAYARVAPETTITWEERVTDGAVMKVATINDAFTGAFVLLDGENMNEILVAFRGDLSENSIMSFIVLGSYASSALLTMEGMDAEAALNKATLDVFSLCTATLDGAPTNTLFGVPAYFQFSSEDGVNYDYYLIIDFMPDEPVEESADDGVVIEMLPTEDAAE